MTEINVMAEKEDEEELANVFLLLVAVQSLVAFEFRPNVGQLLVDPLNFRFFTFT